MRRLIAACAVAVSVLATSSALSPPAGAAPGGTSAPEYYFDQWDVPALWASGADGRGITIAEIDTGVDASLASFAGRVVAGVDFGRLGGDGRVDRDKSDFGHGTAMASIMVGRPAAFGIEGLAPGATLVPIAIPLGGTTDAAPDDRLPVAIRWAADHGAKIISMSLGGVRRPAQFRTACPDDEQQAIFHAIAKGAIVIASAGNQGAAGSPVEEPSVCLGVVSVGAVDSTGTVADFSSRHRYLTLSAPGVNIASIAPGGAPFAGDGTSQAAAIASAATALVWSKYPTLSGRQVLARVLATLDRRSATRDPAYGYGTINPQRAITATVAADAANPVFAAAEPFLRQAAAARVPTPPPAIQRADDPPGHYAVAAPPPVLASRVTRWLVVAGAGLVLLLVLIIGGGVATLRRRRAASRPWSGGPSDPPWSYPPRPPAPPPLPIPLPDPDWRWPDPWAPEPRSE